MYQEILHYLKTFLTYGDEKAAKQIGYTTDKTLWQNYRVVIVPNGHLGKDIVYPTMEPLQITKEGKTYVIENDIIYAAFFFISRAEELIVSERDEHNRFLAKHSILGQHNNLQIPLLDEYARGVMKMLDLPLPPAEYDHIYLTHDIDTIAHYRHLRGFIGGWLTAGMDPVLDALEDIHLDPAYTFPWIIKQDKKTTQLTALMHKAITILQFKEEAQIFDRNPQWHMENCEMLKCIDYEKGTIKIDNHEYQLSSCNFPTIDPKNPYKLTKSEEILMAKLVRSFKKSEKLQRHIQLLLQHGCMYAIYNSNLLFHASCPLNKDGSLREVEVYPGKKYKGKELMHQIGMLIRTAFQDERDEINKRYAIDYFLYLWCGKDSPLFDKSKMATFERYFIKDKSTWKEEKGSYYTLRENPNIVDSILDAFQVQGENRHIINGHVPVHAANGENPIKAEGKLMVIDGGFSQAYHQETGIAGYTLVYHSRGFQLVQHEPFTSAEEAIIKGTDIKSTTQIVEMSSHRMLVGDTDKGYAIKEQIKDLSELLFAYRHGYLKER